MPPEAAVIIPHWNDVARLTRCLAALMPQIGPDTEVVVVDNDSTEPLTDLQASYPDLRIVTETRKGAAFARNRGVAATTAPRLYFLDCDCVPDENWIAVANQVADRGDLVGGAIAVIDETPPPRTGAQAFEAIFAFDNKSYIERQGFSVTANLLTKRIVFDQVGGFLPGLSEDYDWCRRATRAGYQLIYAEELHVRHPSRGDWPSLERKWHRVTRELYGVAGSTPVARLRWAIRALAMPFSILYHAPRVLFSPVLSGADERLAGLATLARLRLCRCGWMLKQAMGGNI
jgi:GT2 family glycosyltransferase